MKQLGKRILARRTRLGITQSALARKVGRTHGWLSAIENGQAGDTPSELLTALAIELGEDPAEYLRLAGRAVLVAEGVIPTAPLDPRVIGAIEAAVERSIRRVGESPATYTAAPDAADPAPDERIVRARRRYWVGQAMAQQKLNAEKLAKRLDWPASQLGPIRAWMRGDLPTGSETRARFARAVGLPSHILESPPPSDEEQLAHWRREAMAEVPWNEDAARDVEERRRATA